jgi:hypothetical protein
MSSPVVPGDHLARVDADPVGQPDTPGCFEVPVEDGERVAHLDGRANGTQGVVLVEGRHAEHGHDRVTDVFLHGPTVPLHDGAHLAEVAGEQVPERLRIESEAESRRVDKIREQDCDRLPDVRRQWQRIKMIVEFYGSERANRHLRPSAGSRTSPKVAPKPHPLHRSPPSSACEWTPSRVVSSRGGSGLPRLSPWHAVDVMAAREKRLIDGAAQPPVLR